MSGSVPFTAVSAEFGVAREVLSRWWKRHEAEPLAGLQPHDINFKYLPALRTARHDFEFAAVDDFSREAASGLPPMRPA